MTNQIKAAGYIRVSSEGQTTNESLPAQRRMIKDYCTRHGYQLTQIYADEGISGTTTKGRPGIQQVIADANAGTFDTLVIKNLKRFGRNTLEILQNHKALTDTGINLIAVQEDIQDTLFMQIKAALAEQEVRDIKERMMGGKISKAQRGVPVGRLPFGRTFDRETETWDIDKAAQQAIKWAAKQFLSGMPMQDVAIEANKRFEYPFSYSNLISTLKTKCGATRTVNFEQLEEPITYEIPRLLPDNMIKKVKAKLSGNRKLSQNKGERDYLFSGAYLRCYHCGKALTGQMQHGKYGYYNHPNKKAHDKCEANFASIPMAQIEQEVLQMIYDDMGDSAGFEKAIKDSIPDADYIEQLRQKETALKRQLSTVKIKIEKLFQRSLEDIFDADRIKQEKQKLDETKNQVEAELATIKNQLANLPDPKEIKNQAQQIRAQLLDKFKSYEHFKAMSFAEKKQLIQFLFEGQDTGGRKYGIYIIGKEGRGKHTELQLQLYGRLRALNTVDREAEKAERTPLLDRESSHSKTNYKRKTTSLGKQRK